MENKVKKTIKDLPKVERPREKLMQYGPEKLSNSELLAILLRIGRPGQNVVEIAKQILRQCGGQKLPNLTLKELTNLSGIGPVKACEIIASFELGKRLLQGKKAEIYLTPRDVWDELRDLRNHKKRTFCYFLS